MPRRVRIAFYGFDNTIGLQDAETDSWRLQLPGDPLNFSTAEDARRFAEVLGYIVLPEPNSCPFCGHSKSYVSKVQSDNGWKFVECCGHCKAHGPQAQTPVDAYALWNGLEKLALKPHPTS